MFSKLKRLFSLLCAIVMLGSVLSAMTVPALAVELNGTVSGKATETEGKLMLHKASFSSVDISAPAKRHSPPMKAAQEVRWPRSSTALMRND